MQSDGNLILYYRKDLKPVWASNSSGSGGETAVMQGDGNFVIYATGARPVFSTNTHGNSGSRVVLENDGNLVSWFDRQRCTATVKFDQSMHLNFSGSISMSPTLNAKGPKIERLFRHFGSQLIIRTAMATESRFEARASLAAPKIAETRSKP